jgi:hypothetical protein
VLDGPDHRRRAIANADGRYELARLEPGEYQIHVTADDGRAGAKVTVSPGQTLERDLDMVEYGSIRGVVVDAATGKPMPGYPVVAYNEGADLSDTFNLFTGGGPKTDREGRFEVGRLGAGGGSVMILDAERNALAPLAKKDFELGPGQDLDLGTIQGSTAGMVPRAERGHYGMETTAARWRSRPGAPLRDRSAPPAGIDPDTELLWVTAVDDGSPGAKAGVAVGDRIIAIDGVAVDAIGAELAGNWLSPQRTRVGDHRTLAIDRDGKQTTATVTADPRAE